MLVPTNAYINWLAEKSLSVMSVRNWGAFRVKPVVMRPFSAGRDPPQGGFNTPRGFYAESPEFSDQMESTVECYLFVVSIRRIAKENVQADGASRRRPHVTLGSRMLDSCYSQAWVSSPVKTPQ